MTERWCGDVRIRIKYHDAGDCRGCVSVVVDGRRRQWRFKDLKAPACWHGAGVAYDSPAAYDKMAGSALAFGAYYETGNRGDDTPAWAPSGELAQEFGEQCELSAADSGGYVIRRIRCGPVVLEHG